MSAIPEVIEDKILRQWQEFTKSGVCAENQVRPRILNSWKRCSKLGISPYNNPKRAKLSDDKMEDILAGNKDLLDIAAPFMANLYKIIENSGFFIALTDGKGYVLKSFDNHGVLIKSPAANFFKGACWSEAEAGTNAIGTSIIIRQPFQVNGAEHYCSQYHWLTCSAAPISDAAGNVAGVLAIVGAAASAHSHTLGMAAAGAAAIAAQIATLGKNRAFNDINRQLTAAKIQKPACKPAQKSNIWHFKDIVGSSADILEAGRVAALAANTSSNVLLYGESGTGKEIFAQAIHNSSDRKAGPFVAVNCGAIPKELITSELFGYEEGSFTGAKKGGRQGKFEIATGGTLFLDEIGDMPSEQQIALLRVLQERKITRIGSDTEIPVDVRIICATNKSLNELIAQGKFREDLYYRLNVISITIPALRDRGKDILILFYHFLGKMNLNSTYNFVLDLEASERLMEYHWPGNVRELQNAVERIVGLTRGPVISLEHLPHEIRFYNSAEKAAATTSGDGSSANQNLSRQHFRKLRAETEKQEILRWLRSCSGNVSMTAKKIGISRNTLYRKMKMYGIES